MAEVKVRKRCQRCDAFATKDEERCPECKHNSLILEFVTDCEDLKPFLVGIANALNVEDTGKLRILLADRLLAEHQIYTMQDNAEVYYFNGGNFTRGGEVVLERGAQRLMELAHAREILTSKLLNEILGEIRRKTYVDRAKFDAHHELLVVENGTLNVLTGELLPHSPELKLITKLSVRYDEAASCPLFDKFLNEVLPPESIETAWQVVGYCLYRRMPIQRAVMLLGGGNNGKSVFLGALKALLGQENYSAIQLQNLDRNRFSLVRFYGSLANICADIPSDALRGTGNFKMLVSGIDPLEAERKFKDSFVFVNYAKLIFSANQVPQTPDESDAYFRRWVILDFPFKFEGKSDDKNLLSKLVTPEELSGILFKARQALERLLAAGDFAGAQKTDELRDRYLRLSDSTTAFFADCLLADSEGEVTKSHLFPAYLRYCKEKRLPNVTEKMFFTGLHERTVMYERQATMPEGRVRVLKGIRFADQDLAKSSQNPPITEDTQIGQSTLLSAQGARDTRGFTSLITREENESRGKDRKNAVYAVHDVH